MGQDTILIGGYASFPSGATAKEVYGILGVALEIDPKTGEIVNAASTLLTDVTKEFVRSLLVGQNMNDGLRTPIETIERTYFGRNKKALIAALMDANKVYKKYMEDKYSL